MISFSNKIIETSSLLSNVVQGCKYLLNNCEKAKQHKDYIYNRLSSHYINKFDIGYFPQDDEVDLLYPFITKEKLLKLKLIYPWFAHDRSHILTKIKSFFNYHNLIFPLKDEYGNIISLAGRTLLNEEKQNILHIQKYKNSFFKKTLHLFGLYQAKKAIYKKNKIIVVEGQVDCIKCHNYGIKNVVALGSTTLSRYHLYLLKKYSNNISLALDNDDPGKESERKILKRYSKYININKIEWPNEFKDPDQYLSNNGSIDIFN